MKNMVSLFFSAIFAVSGVMAQHGVDHIVTDELASTAKAPSEVFELVARPRAQKPTWAIVEKDGEPTGVSGPLTELHRGEKASTYVVGTDTIALPNKDYKMEKGLLYNSRSQKLECIIIELKDCECGPKTGILFGEDSVTTNTFPAHKMVLDSVEVIWRQEGSYFIPGVIAEDVNTVDSSPVSAYGLAIQTEEGATCEIIWLHTEDRVTQTKIQVYEATLREGKRFAQTENGYTLDGKLILPSSKVLKQYTPPTEVRGAKKNKHKKRTKI